MKQILVIIFLLCTFGALAQDVTVTGPKKKATTAVSSKQQTKQSIRNKSSKQASIKTTTKQEIKKEIPISFDESTMTLHYGDKSLKMILVEGGKFVMGEPEPKDVTGLTNCGWNMYLEDSNHNMVWNSDDVHPYPQHLVCLSDYYISETCIPDELREACGWAGNEHFVEKLNQKLSMNFCLPTEAEWEYAMRGGKYSKHTKYIGTDYTDEITDFSKNELGISDYNHESETVIISPYGYDKIFNPGITNTKTGERFTKELNRRKPGWGVDFRIVLHKKSQRYREEQLSQIFNNKGEKKVDLGLSVCWAGYNLYDKETNIVPQKAKEEKRKKHETVVDFSKRIGIADENGIFQEYDPAYLEWGDKWRLPTKKEFQELKEKCSWVWMCYKNINGFYITGPNGNSIFLPVIQEKIRYRSYLEGTTSWASHSYDLIWADYACSEYSNLFTIEKRIGYFNDYSNKFTDSYPHGWYKCFVRPVCDK